MATYSENASYFHHLGFQYLLNPIFEVAELIGTTEVSISELVWMLEGANLDQSRVDSADISIPLIVTDAPQKVIVDGLHRLSKLVSLGVKRVQCVVLKDSWFVEGTFLATTPHAWFLDGCAARRYYFKEWTLRMFAYTELPETYPDSAIKDRQYLEQNQDQELTSRAYWPVKVGDAIGYRNFSDQFVECVGLKANSAIVAVNDTLELNAGDVPNLTQRVVTRIGNVLFNYCTLVYAFGNKIPFQLGKVKIPAVEKLIVAKLVDDVDSPEMEDPDKIYVRELKRYIKAATSMAGLSTICVPAATPRTILPHPEAAALRKKLVAQYAGQLHDPAKVAIIAKELEALDREWIAGDPDAGFYQSDKSFGVIRMKMFGIFGAEQNFRQGGYTFIEQPLEEGWDLAQLPAMIDSLRDGSYNRGAETALGGYEVKTILRTMSGSIISEDDCGVTHGLTTVVTKQNVNELIGHTVVLADGTQVKVQPETTGNYVGQTVQLRTPGFCKTDNNNFCLTCFGDFIADKKQALGVVASELGSSLLLAFMKKMHGSALKTVKYDMFSRIS